MTRRHTHAHTSSTKNAGLLRRPFIVGIAGGTASGKSAFACRVAEQLGAETVAVIDADAYYRPLDHLPIEARHSVNFDHPDAVDSELLCDHIQQLKRGTTVPKPVYDFAQFTRLPETVPVTPLPIIIVEGMLIFAVECLCKLFDLRIFIDADADIRLVRRMLRDTRERGRTVELLANQYMNHVRPMHDAYVEPSRDAANIVVKNEFNVTETVRKIQLLAINMPFTQLDLGFNEMQV